MGKSFIALLYHRRMQPQQLLALVNARHDTTFELVGRYPRGENGAFAVVDHAGRCGVLKQELAARELGRLREIAAITARLRDGGYPAPEYLVVGDTLGACYSIQEELPGAPLPHIPAALIPPLIDLNLAQRGQGSIAPDRGEWPGRVIEPVLHGGDGYCLLAPLRAYSSATAELLDALQALVTAGADARYETDDIVHFDFNPANILIDDGCVGGVVDWQDPCAGDCAFDLVTLFYYSYDDSPDVRALLWRHLIARVSPVVLGVYLAHMVLRQVDWSIRFYDDATVERWLRVSRAVLRDTRAL
jgi:hypothetical protein